MSARPMSTITLPVERILQLRAAADRVGATLSEVVERFILNAIEAGLIPDETPGFIVEPRTGARTGAVTFLHAPSGAGFDAIRPEDARVIAGVLDDPGHGRKGVALGPHFGRTLVIARIGRGVTLVGQDERGNETGRYSVTPGIARDLARQLRKAADQADAPTK